MTKHYKSFGICLGAVLLLGIMGLLLRPFFKITPALHIDYEELVTLYSEQYDLEPALVYAVIRAESNFEPNAQSHAGAYGLMQITEDTLQWAILREAQNAPHTIKDLADPEINIKYGCLILSLLKAEFQDTNTALAAYNAGRGNVIRWLKDSRYSNDGIRISSTPYRETNQYIEKVDKYYKKYQEMLGDAP